MPSGDQSGAKSVTELFVRFVWPLPSAFMTKISLLKVPAPRSVVKTIRVPSGDHAGSQSNVAGLLVTFVWPLPSAFMTKISQLPPRLLKAILVPSGDQAGRTSVAGLLVRLVWPLPSAFMTKISQLGGAAGCGQRVKASLLPSGEPAGK